MRRESGFTLIELLVTLVLVAFLVLASAPLATNWVYGSQTHTGRTQLAEAFNLAKGLALQNPNAVALPAAASGMKVTTDGTTTTLYVCTGSSAATGCANGGASVRWSTTYSGLVTTSINGVAATTSAPLTWDFDNRGESLSGTTLSYVIARGGTTNDESGNVY
jgi:prepilin-type N-terminal cleavage/methylation domain-containing protein